jgi:hypothetical protein
MLLLGPSENPACFAYAHAPDRLDALIDWLAPVDIA